MLIKQINYYKTHFRDPSMMLKSKSGNNQSNALDTHWVDTVWSFRFSSGSVSVCTHRISIVRGMKIVIHNNRNPTRAYTYTYTWKSETPKFHRPQATASEVSRQSACTMCLQGSRGAGPLAVLQGALIPCPRNCVFCKVNIHNFRSFLVYMYRNIWFFMVTRVHQPSFS